MAEIHEKPTSPEISTGDNASVTRKFYISKAVDHADAMRALRAKSEEEQTFDVFGDQTVVYPVTSLSIAPLESVDQDNKLLFEGTIVYSPSGGGTLITGQKPAEFEFRATATTTHITTALRTEYAIDVEGNEAPDLNNAINVTNNSIDGVDIYTPQFELTETYLVPKSFFEQGYLADIAYLLCRTNNGPFRGFKPGEVLFLGASCKTTSDTNFVEVTYNFAISPRGEDLEFPPFPGKFTKEGFDYLWIRWEDSSEEGHAIKKPQALYINRVYRTGDFSLLRLPGS